MVVSLNQRSVEFSFLYTTRSSSDLTFKQSGQVDDFRVPGHPDLGDFALPYAFARVQSKTTC